MSVKLHSRGPQFLSLTYRLYKGYCCLDVWLRHEGRLGLV